MGFTMRKLILFVVALMFLSCPTYSQNNKKFDVSAGYDYLRVNKLGVGDEIRNLNNFHGFSVGVNFDNGTFEKQGMATSIGLMFYSYFHANTVNYSYTYKTNFGGVKVPVRIGCVLPLSQNVRIVPYVGVSFMYNLFGKDNKHVNINAVYTNTYSNDLFSSTYTDNNYSLSYNPDQYNEYSKNNWDKWDRIMMPAMVGLKINISRFDIDLKYDLFMGEFGKSNGQGFSISFGCRL